MKNHQSVNSNVTVEEAIIGKGESTTFLKSIAHLRKKSHKEGHLRSVLVGLQFGVLMLPKEVLGSVVLPFFSGALIVVSYAVKDLLGVLFAAIGTIIDGFANRLEATSHTEKILVYMDKHGNIVGRADKGDKS